jgi:hypothetical protein
VSTLTVGRMRASSARRPWSGPVAAVVLALLVTGCSEEKKAAPEPAPTPIARLDTAAMQVPRIEFCTLVPSSAVADALGGEPESDTAYGNGDEEQLPGMGSDVVHEIGCSWVGEDGAAARAWVFARPVDPAFARSVIASTRKARGCRRVPGPAYGTPSVTQLCRLPGGGQRVRHAGLFGQTWLTCELAATAPEPELRARTDAWCVEVAGALDTAR